jgi:hypothetical protein
MWRVQRAVLTFGEMRGVLRDDFLWISVSKSLGVLNENIFVYLELQSN